MGIRDHEQAELADLLGTIAGALAFVALLAVILSIAEVI